MISIRSTLSSGIDDQMMLPMSSGLTRWPSTRISVLLVAVAPKPRISTVALRPMAPPSELTLTPARALSTSGRFCAGVWRISWRVMTETLAATPESASAKRVAVTTTASAGGSAASVGKVLNSASVATVYG